MKHTRMRLHALLLATLISTVAFTHAASLDTKQLQSALDNLQSQSDGRFGACVSSNDISVCTQGDERFPMQGIVQIPVAIAALDAVDRGLWHLDDKMDITRADLSVFRQPIADKIGPKGYRTTIAELLEYMVVNNDNAATDLLIRRLGDAKGVQHILQRLGFKDISITRDLRHLQTDMLGLSWVPAYADGPTFEQAVTTIPPAKRQAAFDAYLIDQHDTATPQRMNDLLRALAQGKLLSPKSTDYLLDLMQRNAIAPDRLKAGTPADWTLRHKAASGNTWKGVSPATNDVGLLSSPDGSTMAISVFISNSQQSDIERAALIANVSRAAANALLVAPADSSGEPARKDKNMRPD